MEETDEAVELVERVAALDIGKATLTCCIRIPHEANPARRRQEVTEYSTTTRSLLGLADRLRSHGVTLVAMEATSDYWKPAFYLLETEGFECWLLNAKNVPGRPKTDKLDAVWLAKVVERGMCRPSFVPPKPIRQLRDLTRYRRTLIREQTREKQRLEKLLEDAQIKLSATVSDVFGVSGRQMIQAMITGQRDPKVLAQMARGPMRAKISKLQEALTGHFEDHHAFICQMMLERIDELTIKVDELSRRIDLVIAPFAHQVTQLDEVSGIGQVAAQELIAEIGVDMTVFPTAGHLASWAGRCPGNNLTGGKRRSGKPTKGNRWLGEVLIECAWAAARSRDTYLSAQYWRLARRIGKKKAAVAVGHSILVIAWHLLANDCDYADLGGDYFVRRDTDRQRQRAVAQLQALGYRVVLQPVAA